MCLSPDLDADGGSLTQVLLTIEGGRFGFKSMGGSKSSGSISFWFIYHLGLWVYYFADLPWKQAHLVRMNIHLGGGEGNLISQDEEIFLLISRI